MYFNFAKSNGNAGNFTPKVNIETCFGNKKFNEEKLWIK